MHAVRDDHRVAAEVLDLHAAGEVRDRDPAADPLQPRPHHRAPARPAHFDRVVAAWKVATIGPLAIMQTSSDDRRRRRLVHVDDVEAPLAQPAAHPRGRHRAELHAGHRAVVRDRHGAPGEGDPLVGERLLVLGRREHLDVVAHAAQRLGQVAHVVLHPAGDVPLVGADQADAHQAALPGRSAGRRPGGTSAQIRPSMCQSSGCSAIAVGERVGHRLHRRGRPGPAAGPGRRRAPPG